MTDVLLSQVEGDALLEMEKYSSMENIVDFSGLSGDLELKFLCEEGREEFVINYTRHSINIMKRNHHLRVKKAIGLARLDLDGPPHRNPDGVEVGPRHLHIYREGYGLKWAYDVPEQFTSLDDAYKTLSDFMKYCNVIQPPEIKVGLFS